jgi:hypothetical protein
MHLASGAAPSAAAGALLIGPVFSLEMIFDGAAPRAWDPHRPALALDWADRLLAMEDGSFLSCDLPLGRSDCPMSGQQAVCLIIGQQRADGPSQIRPITQFIGD